MSDRLASVRVAMERIAAPNWNRRVLDPRVAEQALEFLDELERLLGLLKQLEWACDTYEGSGGGCCPACSGLENEAGHKANCKLAAALQEAP